MAVDTVNFFEDGRITLSLGPEKVVRMFADDLPIFEKLGKVLQVHKQLCRPNLFPISQSQSEKEKIKGFWVNRQGKAMRKKTSP